ncbi:MAG: ABC transporter ATP-binding protein [Propionibacteriaceae bacterium]|jgi:ABC-type dipeptide/oligopeptide/nickel transport system ATPase component|nr:ABC transporter ATP-binding protein [Propionibacteriaceae bacterium]
MSLLRVDDLAIRFSKRAPAVKSVSFALDAGERLGIIGESGSGKSVTALAIMGLLPEYAVLEGSIQVDGQEIIGLSDAELSKLRGKVMTMVFQEPMTALDPTMRVGRQVAEAYRKHTTGAEQPTARERVVDVLGKVGLEEPERVADSYPHELSGGQRQRALIAMAVINEPSLIIFDEPTTALDVTVQAQVLELIDAVLAHTGASCLFISHNLAVVAQVAKRVLVLKDGEVVEAGEVGQLLSAPEHPYTQALVAAARRGGGDA